MLSKKIITTNFRDDSISIINEVYPFEANTFYIKDLLRNDREDMEKKGPIDLLMDKKNKLLVVNSLNDSICKIDIEARELNTFIKVGRYPTSIRIFSDKIYIINSDSNSLSIINEDTMESIETIPLGNNPNSIEIDEIYKKIYITNFENSSINILDFKGEIQEYPLLDKPLKIKIIDKYIYLLSIINNDNYNSSRFTALNREDLRKIWSVELKGLFYDFIKVDELSEFYFINPDDRFLYSFKESDKELKRLIFLGGLPKKVLYDGNDKLFINDIFNNEILIRY